MPYFSNEKRYGKNSNGFELQEQLVNFSRQSESNFRRWWVKNIMYLSGNKLFEKLF